MSVRFPGDSLTGVLTEARKSSPAEPGVWYTGKQTEESPGFTRATLTVVGLDIALFKLLLQVQFPLAQGLPSLKGESFHRDQY